MNFLTSRAVAVPLSSAEPRGRKARLLVTGQHAIVGPYSPGARSAGVDPVDQLHAMNNTRKDVHTNTH